MRYAAWGLALVIAFTGGYFRGFEHQGGIISNFQSPSVPMMNPFDLYGRPSGQFVSVGESIWVKDGVKMRDITVALGPDGMAEISGNCKNEASIAVPLWNCGVGVKCSIVNW